MARERVEFDIIGKDLGGSKAFRDVGDAAAKAGDKIEDSGDKATDAGGQYRGLANNIEQVEASIRQLATEIDRTGNKTLFKDLNRQRSELRRLNQVRGLLPDMDREGEAAASGFATAFVGRLGPLVARAPLGGVGVAAGTAIAAALVPVVAAAVSGAVLGGVGTGGVVGGVALAAKDTRVQSASKDLAASVMGDLEESAARFVQPTITSIGIIRTAWADVSDEVDDTFAVSSRYLVPLAKGAADAAREIAPGFRDAARAAAPVMREISAGLPRLGRAVNDVLADISDNADEAAGGMRGLFIAGETAIRVGGTVLSTFADIFGVVVKLGQGVSRVQDFLFGWIPGLDSVTGSWVSNWDEMNDAMTAAGENGGEAGSSIFDSLRKAAGAASTATVEVRSFSDALRELRDQNLQVIDTEIAFERTLDESAEAARRAKGGIDTTTEAGRKNMEVLSGLVRDTKAHSAAVLERTMSEDQAAKVTERGRKAFLATAAAMGVERGEANRLADQLFGIPTSRESNVDVKIRQTPIDLATVAGRIAAIKSKRVVVTVVNNTVTTRSEGRNVGIGDGVGGRASGGQVARGQTFWVGENGRELVTFTDNGYVLNSRQSQDIARGAMAASTAPAARSSSATDGALLAELRALRRLLSSTPLVRADPARAADLMLRTGG